MKGHGLGLGGVRELLRVLGVHLVELVHGELGHRLARGHALDDSGDALVAARDVMRDDPHRPLFAGSLLLPVGLAELLQDPGRFLGLRLELLG